MHSLVQRLCLGYSPECLPQLLLHPNSPRQVESTPEPATRTGAALNLEPLGHNAATRSFGDALGVWLRGLASLCAASVLASWAPSVHLRNGLNDQGRPQPACFVLAPQCCFASPRRKASHKELQVPVCRHIQAQLGEAPLPPAHARTHATQATHTSMHACVRNPQPTHTLGAKSAHTYTYIHTRGSRYEYTYGRAGLAGQAMALAPRPGHGCSLHTLDAGRRSSS